MRRWRRGLARMASLITVILASGLAVPASHAATGLSTVTQNLLPGLANATALGAAPADTPMSVVVTLARPNAAAERALLDAEHNPASPHFGQFLSPEEFAANFGVPQAQLDQANAWLTKTGMTIDSVS